MHIYIYIYIHAMVKVWVSQSCLTLCSPMDYSLPDSSVHGIHKTRILDWVAISSSRGNFQTQGSNPGLLHCRDSLPSEPLTKHMYRFMQPFPNQDIDWFHHPQNLAHVTPLLSLPPATPNPGNHWSILHHDSFIFQVYQKNGVTHDVTFKTGILEVA